MQGKFPPISSPLQFHRALCCSHTEMSVNSVMFFICFLRLRRTFFLSSSEEQLPLKVCIEFGDYFTPLNVMDVPVRTKQVLMIKPKVGNNYSEKAKVRSSEPENHRSSQGSECPLLMAKLQTAKGTWRSFENVVIKSLMDRPACQSNPSAGSRAASVPAGAVGQMLCDILLLPESVVARVPPQAWCGQAEQRDRQSPQGNGGNWEMVCGFLKAQVEDPEARS
ncbi:uncharacterized protein LOC114057280 [Empidonax traillii]|uniref:uncharacterized protein LOC114057280 n=1 Tax=Empidonax traillii TaxID=164674 RepID=UPI000FFD1148|nr:uncharacterized protein LOC114057280 [Empidonax traillii]